MSTMPQQHSTLDMQLDESPTAEQLQKQHQAITKSIEIVENALKTERAASQPDRFGRRLADMPQALRDSYQKDKWREHDIYLWPRVLAISKDGHNRAANAQRALAHLSHTQEPLDPEVYISSALSAAQRLGIPLRRTLSTRIMERVRAAREKSRRYTAMRRLWMQRMDDQHATYTEAEKQKRLERDRRLLVATRAPSGMGGGMSSREVDLIFAEIEAAGGTAGGLERWGRSITGIPAQNSERKPPGGVLIENPLTEHYAARNINPWTHGERKLFLEKFLIHGKNFKKVATFFEYKSVEDVVRFYFDNKMPLKLKQLAKDAQFRKRSTKKNALSDLARLPTESRSIRDNFIHQVEEMSGEKSEDVIAETTPSEATIGGDDSKKWTRSEQQSLIFALCEFKVTDEQKSNALSSVWLTIAGAVGTKTPRQCWQFYIEKRTELKLDSYSPPETVNISRKRPASILASEDDDKSQVQKIARTSPEILKGNGTNPTTVWSEYCANGGSATGNVT